MPLTAVAPGLWSHVHTMRMPGGVRIPARMNIARVGSQDGDGLWVHSPVPIDDALAAEITALGRVLYVVAPSAYHHMFTGKFAARFPGAKLFAAPGVARKHPELTFEGTLAEGAAPPWSGEIDQIFIEGAPKLSEVVFFHRASRSLLVSDLFFNVTEPETWATGLVLRMMGTYKRFGRSRAWNLYGKDRKLLKASVEKVLDWDFVRVLPGHGVPFETAATHAETRTAAAWFLE